MTVNNEQTPCTKTGSNKNMVLDKDAENLKEGVCTQHRNDITDMTYKEEGLPGKFDTDAAYRRRESEYYILSIVGGIDSAPFGKVQKLLRSTPNRRLLRVKILNVVKRKLAGIKI